MVQSYCNQCYLFDFELFVEFYYESDFVVVLCGVKVVLIVVFSYVFVLMLDEIVLLFDVDVVIVWVSKGFEFGIGCFLYELVVEKLLGCLVVVVIGLLFVKEVVVGLFSVVIVYFDDELFVCEVVGMLYVLNFCVYIGSDVLGVEFGGVMKNVLVVVIGVVDGMQLGFNVCVGLIICGMNEMLWLGLVFGVKFEMLMGLFGLGDLVFICIGDFLCNCWFGLVLGKGIVFDEVVCQIG